MERMPQDSAARIAAQVIPEILRIRVFLLPAVLQHGHAPAGTEVLRLRVQRRAEDIHRLI